MRLERESMGTFAADRPRDGGPAKGYARGTAQRSWRYWMYGVRAWLSLSRFGALWVDQTF